MKTARLVSVLGITASWLVWLAGNFVWVVSDIGSATGAALFGWLWLPGLAFSISMLFQRTRIGGAKIAGVLATLISLGLTISLIFYDWSRSDYLLRQASAHSGQELEQIESFTLAPWVFIAIGLLVITSGALAYTTLVNGPAVHKIVPTENSESTSASPDARSIWDEQSN